MHTNSLRFTVALTLLAVVGWPAAVLANHGHISGGSSSGGGGTDPDADCLVWGYVLADGGKADATDAADDGGMSDGGASVDASQPPDAATGDGGSGPPPGAVMVCLEHATLFGCDCATGPAAGSGWPRGALALVAAMLLASRRRRRDRSTTVGGERP